MNNSNKLQGKQITKYLGHLEEVQVETGDNQGTLSKDLAFSKRERENDVVIETSDLLGRILARENMTLAMKRVIKNDGSHGVDGMGCDELRTNVIKHWDKIKIKLLDGTYKPSPVRRVEIPKPDGSKRLLGIPTVLDRMIQQAIAQELNKIYEPTFSESSYGFRPGKSQHIAMKQAKEHINEGYKWVVDMDLEKFFDTVQHDVLMNKLSKKIGTKHKNLTKLGIQSWKAWEYANTRKGYWRISNSPIVSTTLGNKYLEELGYKSITKRYQLIH